MRSRNITLFMWSGLLLAIATPTPLRSNNSKVDDLTAQAEQHIASGDYIFAGAALSPLQIEVRAKVPGNLSVGRNRESLAYATDRQSTLAALRNLKQSYTRGDWEDALFYLKAAYAGLARLDQQMLPHDKLARAKTLVEAHGSNTLPVTFHQAGRLAFEAGDFRQARNYLDQEIELLPQKVPANVVASMLHRAYTLKGATFLAEGDVRQASETLLSSLNVDPKDSLQTTGPSMMLAKLLLVKGQSAVVLTYLDQCETLGWVEGAAKLSAWKQAIRAGALPNFGANALLY